MGWFSDIVDPIGVFHDGGSANPLKWNSDPFGIAGEATFEELIEDFNTYTPMGEVLTGDPSNLFNDPFGYPLDEIYRTDNAIARQLYGHPTGFYQNQYYAPVFNINEGTAKYISPQVLQDLEQAYQSIYVDQKGEASVRSADLYNATSPYQSQQDYENFIASRMLSNPNFTSKYGRIAGIDKLGDYLYQIRTDRGTYTYVPYELATGGAQIEFTPQDSSTLADIRSAYFNIDPALLDRADIFRLSQQYLPTSDELLVDGSMGKYSNFDPNTGFIFDQSLLAPEDLQIQYGKWQGIQQGYTGWDEGQAEWMVPALHIASYWWPWLRLVAAGIQARGAYEAGDTDAALGTLASMGLGAYGDYAGWSNWTQALAQAGANYATSGDVRSALMSALPSLLPALGEEFGIEAFDPYVRDEMGEIAYDQFGKALIAPEYNTLINQSLREGTLATFRSALEEGNFGENLEKNAWMGLGRIATTQYIEPAMREFMVDTLGMDADTAQTGSTFFSTIGQYGWDYNVSKEFEQPFIPYMNTGNIPATSGGMDGQSPGVSKDTSNPLGGLSGLFGTSPRNQTNLPEEDDSAEEGYGQVYPVGTGKLSGMFGTATING